MGTRGCCDVHVQSTEIPSEASFYSRPSHLQVLKSVARYQRWRRSAPHSLKPSSKMVGKSNVLLDVCVLLNDQSETYNLCFPCRVRWQIVNIFNTLFAERDSGFGAER